MTDAQAWTFSNSIHGSFRATTPFRLSFFAELLQAVQRDKPDNNASQQRAKKLRLYARLAVLGAGAMKFVGRAARSVGDDMAAPSALLETAAGAVENVGDSVTQAAEAYEAQAAVSNQSLAELKRSLAKDMAKLKRPLLIVIDDIDRLTSDEIREVFQLVKANADFPNIIYLLMFDRQIVASALDVISGNRGRSFLEKIVQVAFHVPLPALSDVHTVLSEGLDACLAQEGVATRWDEGRWIDVWFYGLRPYFMNLRSVYRFLSSLQFQISQMRNGKTFELNPMDLIALEAIRLFEPMLYEVLGASRSILVPDQVERLETGLLSDDEKRKRPEANQERLLSYVPAERRKNVTVILKDLFPVLFEETPDEGQMHRDLRAGIGAFFDRYFTLSLHSDDVPQADIDALLETISKPNEFSRVCESLMRMGKLDKAFDRLDAYNCNLSKHDFPAIITSLADVGDTLPHAEWATAQTADALKNSWRLIFFSLRSIEDENRRFDLLRDGFVHELRASKIVKRQSTNVFIERDGNFGMYRLRPQPKGLRLLYTLDPPNRIGETDPPDLVFRLNLHKVAGNRGGHVPFLGCYVKLNPHP